MSAPSLQHLDAPQRAVATLLRANTTRHRLYEVFRDFCELSALSISNAVDRSQFETRERRYLDIVSRYTKEEIERFPQMLASVVSSLEETFKDCLGELFTALELADHWKGQFFTPYTVALAMAQMTLVDVDAEWIGAQGGFITLNEPAVGAGAMVIAAAQALRDHGINYQQCLHVTAQDIDATAVHMAYIQLSLLHVPARILRGNSLTLEVWEQWVTPAHVVGLWDMRLRAERAPVEVDRLKLPERSPAPDGEAIARAAAPDAGQTPAKDEEHPERAEQLKLF